MWVRSARNIALVALVAVALGFSLETAVMGALLDAQGDSADVVGTFVRLSVGSLFVAIAACARAVAVVHRTPRVELPGAVEGTSRRLREDALVA